MAIAGYNTESHPNNEEPLNENLTNNSGQGPDSQVLCVVANRFNWGAFWFTWIWGIANKSYLTLIIFAAFVLAFIPIIGPFVELGLRIWFGVEGNKWAWQNKRWESIESFHETQRVWAICGNIILGLLGTLAIVGIVAAMTIPSLVNSTHKAQINAMIKKEISAAKQVVELNEALDHKCGLTSEAITQCFAERMNTSYVGSTYVSAFDGSGWTFNGNGSCVTKGECSITIDAQGSTITIPLYVKSNGYLEIRQEDLEEYISK